MAPKKKEIPDDEDMSISDKLFIAAYIRNKCNGTRAQKEIDPEMTDEVAASTASQKLRKIKVKEAVDKKLREIADLAEIDAYWALKKRQEIVERCMQAEPVMEFDHQEKCMVETGEYQFDSAGANRALEAIEKLHLGMAEKSEVSATVALISRDDESL